MKVIEVGTRYKPRPHQRMIHEKRKRFNVLVCHRRFGKTVCAVNELIHGALSNKKDQPRYAYIAPLYKQAKAICWDYFRQYTSMVPDVKLREYELRIDFPNQARIQLFGADNPDHLRGIYLDGVVIDEMALMPRRLWGEVVRPTLADRQGWVMFMGTPQGHNIFYDLFRHARSDPLWFCGFYPASRTGVIPKEELEAARKAMTPQQFAQEFECSFEAAITGAYYGKLLDQAMCDGRIADTPADPSLPVHTAWDLGVSDATAIWFFQLGPAGELRVVDFYENAGWGLDHYVKVLLEKGHVYGAHIGPHDVRVRELGTGKSRLETAQALGVRFSVAPRLPIMDGIDAVRMLLPRCRFDKTRCAKGLEALKLYRSQTDANGRVQGPPVHDWTSHAADAMRYLATGLHLARGHASMTEQEAQRLYEKYAPPI